LPGHRAVDERLLYIGIRIRPRLRDYGGECGGPSPIDPDAVGSAPLARVDLYKCVSRVRVSSQGKGILRRTEEVDGRLL